MNTSNLSIIICGIVRNAEKGLKNNIPIIKKVCSQFKDYRVVIYENDSIDKTKKILKDWKKDNPERIHVLLNDTDKSKCVVILFLVKSAFRKWLHYEINI